jgi:DNA-binding response OmpR family regulator
VKPNKPATMMRIILAEDDPLAAEVMKGFLGNLVSNIDVERTLAGLEAKSKTDTYDIVILDLRLLDSDHTESIKAIRRLKSEFDAPLIVVSGMDLIIPNLREDSMKAGADAYISKSDAYDTKSKAMLMALHAAILHHPKPNRSPTFLDHVAALERLVNATA